LFRWYGVDISPAFMIPFFRSAGWFLPKEITVTTEEDVTDSFVGEIRIFGFNWAPTGWALCNGDLLPVAQNQALFSLIFNYYGGDGVTTFALPDLRGRTWYGYGGINQQTGKLYNIGNAAGSETVALTVATLPTHNHLVAAVSAVGTNLNPEKEAVFFAETPATGPNLYAPISGAPQPLNPASVEVTGSGGGHNNMQPFSVVNFCICTTGIYPPRP